MGCSKNLVDSERLMGQLAACGYKMFHDADDVKGEIVIVNTCGFIGDAKEESINMILELCEAKKRHKIGQIFVMGGGETYRQALPTADKLYITHVHATIEDADTFFPVIDPDIWEVESTTPVQTDPETGYGYEFTVYRRRD